MSDTALNETGRPDWRRLLTTAERAVMLRDIACVALAAGARLFPDQPWSDLPVAAGSAVAPKSPLEQLGFIEYLLPVLAQSVSQIASSPLTNTVAQSCPALPHRARRVTASAWMSYARQAQSKQSVEETVTFLSHDTPENRAIKSFLTVLKRDSHAIAQIAEAENEMEAAGRALCAARCLDRWLSEPWWKEITPRSGGWTLPPTRREGLRPDYARLSQERSRYRKGFGFDWSQPLLTLPPRETWRLYEIWCFLTVLHTLHGLGWELTAPQEVFAVCEGRLIFTLATGNQSRIGLRSAQGSCLSLTYNPAFAEGHESLSHTMQPDMALSDGKRVWILDAKFKPYAEPGEEGSDINQMHAYRDAIIGGQGTRNVARAWCLYAGLAETVNRPHLTYGRTAGVSVGALCLRPANAETVTNLRRLLEQWLGPDSMKQAPPLFPET